MNFIKIFDAIPNIGMSGADLMKQLTDPNLVRADVLATLPPEAAAKAYDVIHHLDKLAVSINTGTNIPSVATPNGQAAFLFCFLLTFGAGPGLSACPNGRMVWLAMPYTITMSITGLAATYLFL